MPTNRDISSNDLAFWKQILRRTPRKQYGSLDDTPKLVDCHKSTSGKDTAEVAVLPCSVTDRKLGSEKLGIYSAINQSTKRDPFSSF